MPLPIQAYKWIPTNCQGNLTKMLGGRGIGRCRGEQWSHGSPFSWIVLKILLNQLSFNHPKDFYVSLVWSYVVLSPRTSPSFSIFCIHPFGGGRVGNVQWTHIPYRETCNTPKSLHANKSWRSTGLISYLPCRQT